MPSAASTVGTRGAPGIEKILAPELARAIERLPGAADLAVYPCTFTLDKYKGTSRKAVVQALGPFKRKLKSMGCGAILALDFKNGRWHVHGVIVAPRRWTPEQTKHKVTRAWARLLRTKGSQPVRRAQDVGNALLTRGALEHELAHALLRRDPGVQHEPLSDRVFAAGVLAPVWRAVASRLRVPGFPSSDKAPPNSSDQEDSTHATSAGLGRPRKPPHVKAKPGVTCAWCGKKLKSGGPSGRAIKRWCADCAKLASDALSDARRNLSRYAGITVRTVLKPAVRIIVVRSAITEQDRALFNEWIKRLEHERFWLRREAIRHAQAMVWAREECTDKELSKATRSRCPICEKPLGTMRIDAKTCGREECRRKRYRDPDRAHGAAASRGPPALKTGKHAMPRGTKERARGRSRL